MIRTLALALVAATALVAAAAPARAAAPGAREQQRLDASIRYLQEVQNRDGGFGGTRGGASDPIFTSWAALALASAGINPRDQALPGGKDAIAYLVVHLDLLEQTTDFERTLLVAVAAGLAGRSFGGRDLVTPIVARQLPDGSFPQTASGPQGAINATAFAILSLSLVDDPTLKPAIARAADYLLAAGVQNANGSWDWVAGAPGGSDMTAAVIEALRAAGRPETDAEQRAFAYLRTTQNDDGGFGMSPGAASNSMSTAWVLQAMWAAEIDPASWARAGGTPLDYLASMQQPDGSVRYMADNDANRIWSTAQVAPALAGRPLPILPVARAAAPVEPPKRHRRTPPRRERGAGEGGRTGPSRQRGDGTIYGGGGSGAPLYSQPEPDGAAAPTPVTRRRDDRASGAHVKRTRSRDRTRARRRTATGRGGGAAAGDAGAAVPDPPAAASAGTGAATDVSGTLVAGGDTAATDPAPSLQNAGGAPGGAAAPLIAGALGAVVLAGAGLELRRRPRSGP